MVLTSHVSDAAGHSARAAGREELGGRKKGGRCALSSQARTEEREADFDQRGEREERREVRRVGGDAAGEGDGEGDGDPDGLVRGPARRRRRGGAAAVRDEGATKGWARPLEAWRLADGFRGGACGRAWRSAQDDSGHVPDVPIRALMSLPVLECVRLRPHVGRGISVVTLADERAGGPGSGSVCAPSVATCSRSLSAC